MNTCTCKVDTMNDDIVQYVLSSQSGTINFYPYTFNQITKNRIIMFQGAVPLHEITYNLYDFCLHFLNNTSKNVDTYLSVIIKDNSFSRPRTSSILTLKGEKTRKKRLAHIRQVIPQMIEFFTKMFERFITINGLEIPGQIYREDTHFNELKKSQAHFKETIIATLNSIK